MLGEKKAVKKIAQMTRAQQESFYKDGKIAFTVMIIVWVIMLAIMALALCDIHEIIESWGYSVPDKLSDIMLYILSVLMIVVFSICGYMVIKYPRFSTVQWIYINKMRKGKVPDAGAADLISYVETGEEDSPPKKKFLSEKKMRILMILFYLALMAAAGWYLSEKTNYNVPLILCISFLAVIGLFLITKKD